MKKRQIYKSYISYIDWSVVCIYPLLRGHVVERSCGGNKTIIHAAFVHAIYALSTHVVTTGKRKSFHRHIMISCIFLDNTYLRVWLPSDCISVLRGNQKKKKEGERDEDMHRGRKSPQAARRTLLVLWGSLLRLIGQWWGTCEVSQVLARWRGRRLAHLPGGCYATHPVKNTLSRLPKCLISIWLYNNVTHDKPRSGFDPVGRLTRSRAAGQELHISSITPLLLLLQSLRLFFHLQLLNPGLDGCQLLRKTNMDFRAWSRTWLKQNTALKTRLVTLWMNEHPKK